MSLWKFHPHVRTGQRLTRGERAADRMRNGMGSWPFVFGALVFLAIWMAFNRDVGFDPYPFILLNLVLSCIAALQGAILLIAAKRADQISAELAVHTFEIDKENLELTRLIHDLTVKVEQLTREIHTHISAGSNSAGVAESVESHRLYDVDQLLRLRVNYLSDRTRCVARTVLVMDSGGVVTLDEHLGVEPEALCEFGKACIHVFVVQHEINIWA
ncbi:MAG: DUF1003 domain-containing protein [Actinobacteria bacterium]|nr:DUF1003 domain-containing protein [Actinomycetota bacterium]